METSKSVGMSVVKTFSTFIPLKEAQKKRSNIGTDWSPDFKGFLMAVFMIFLKGKR